MKNKKITVALKFYKGELNPFDQASLEVALETGAQVTVLAMAPLSYLPYLKNLTRLGVQAILISDQLYAGSDTLATSLILSHAIKKINPDLVFCGRQSIDGDTAQVPPMLAKRIGYKIANKVVEINDDKVKTRNGKEIQIENKTVLTFERIRELRFPSIFSKETDVEVWDNSILGIDPKMCGFYGSPTQVVKTYQSYVGKRICKFIQPEDFDRIIRKSISTSKKENFVTKSAEKLDLVCYIGNVEQVAKSIADKTFCIDYKGKTAQSIAELLIKNNIKVVLFSDEEELKILASEVAVLTNSGLCADCISLRVENGKFIMTRPAQGGDITADIICKSSIAMCTVRTVKKTEKDIIFSVGKGAVSKIESIKKLANEYDAELCASRAVVDSGKMPYSSQVGLTGKNVCPKVYVALGISGAVQHTCAISNVDTVIAINSDKNARIFDYADYGIVTEIDKIL